MFQLDSFRLILSFVVILCSLEMPSKAATKSQSKTHSHQRQNTHLAKSVSEVVEDIKPKRKRKAGKGPTCLIVPGILDEPDSKVRETQELWSLNPLFLWHIKTGNVTKIELFKKGSNEAFWIREIPEGKTSFVYDGRPLKPGYSYEWRIIANVPFPMKSITDEFQVMESQKRLPITIKLALLEHRFKKQGADAEKIALEKVSYFAQKELWSDVFGEIYQVKNPSEKLKREKQELLSSDYCN